MEIERERNRNSLERITFHLDHAARFCNQLDLWGLVPPKQREWDKRVTICKDTIELSKESVQKLGKILE